MIDTHEDGKTELRLAFNKNVERLEDIDRPDICNDYVESAHDIIAAYLKYTTFTAKVWVNYDTSWKKFFVDKRIEDCGRLVSLKYHDHSRPFSVQQAYCARSWVHKMRSTSRSSKPSTTCS